MGDDKKQKIEAIFKAIESQDLQKLEACILKDKDCLTLFDHLSYSPLDRIIMSDYKEALDLLVKHGANLDQQDMLGKTALHCAILHRKWVMALALLEAGASPTLSCAQNKNAMHYAIAANQKEIIQNLISHGVDLQEPQIGTLDYISFAVRHRKVEALSVLLSLGPTLAQVKMAWDVLEKESSRWTAKLFFEASEIEPILKSYLEKVELDAISKQSMAPNTPGTVKSPETTTRRL